MGGQQLIQRLGAVVHGKTYVLDEAFRLRLGRKVPHVVLIEFCRTRSAYVVEQEEVHVIKPQTLTRNRERSLGRFFVGLRPGQAFRRHRVGFTRVALHQRLAQRYFGSAFVVHERGVEVRAAAGYELVNHLLELFDIDAGLVVCVQQRQTHASESQLGRAQKLVAHESPLTLSIECDTYFICLSALQVKSSEMEVLWARGRARHPRMAP